MKPTLLILAAGIGSRYGGLKQIDPVGPSGEVIMDYSVFDALRAGFGKVVFVIRHDFERQFKELVGAKYERHIPVAYAFQELTTLPTGFSVPEGRTKPWGTGHAILMARDAIAEPFAMINADDFYGREAYTTIASHLGALTPSSTDWCMVGYKIGNTLSEHGGVARAICETRQDWLQKIAERFEIVRQGESVNTFDKAGTCYPVSDTTLCSMNYFGFTPLLFDLLTEGFTQFLTQHGGEMKTEYLIPNIVNDIVASGKARMKVLSCDASWFGITFPQDKARVQASIRSLVDAGAYPSPLWA